MFSRLSDLKAGFCKRMRVGESSSSASPRVWTSKDHPLNRAMIDNHACQVIDVLVAAGYEAYLVGGCVRDLWLGHEPKDYDVVTNAKPDDVLKCFKRARLIGRRFQLVHVVFGRKVIEVATFRRSVRPSWVKKKNKHAAHNAFGTRVQDAVRRDFSVNALYYDLVKNEIIDDVGGVEDLCHRRFRMIGDPHERYHEDPVRLLRAIRLMAKLDLSPVEATLNPIRELMPLLANVSTARLFDEINKAFLYGASYKNFYLMRDYHALGFVFPGLAGALEKSDYKAFIDQALHNTDDRYHKGLSLNPCFLLSVLLWHAYQMAYDQARADGQRPYMAKQHAMTQVIKQQLSRLTIPKRLVHMIKEIWSFQYLLEQRRDRQVRYVIEQKRFRAAYDFLCLRAECDQALQSVAQWWTRFQTLDKTGRRAMQDALRDPSKQRKEKSA